MVPLNYYFSQFDTWISHMQNYNLNYSPITKLMNIKIAKAQGELV